MYKWERMGVLKQEYCDLAKMISPSVHLWHGVDYYDNDDDEEDNRRK